jgi:hypothetical protein
MAPGATETLDRFTGPFPGQQVKFFERTERKLFYGGAGGGGKTVCGIAKFCQQLAIERERFRTGKIKQSKAWGLYLRRNTTDLKQAIDLSHQVFLDIDPDAVFNINNHTWTFPSCGNAKFEFGHMEHERSKFKYKSNAYTYIFFDELTEFTETQYEYMDTRLRTTDPVLEPMLQLVAASNPDGVGIVWVRDMFIEGREPETVYRTEVQTSTGKVINYDQIFIPAKLRDNPALYGSGRYEAALMTKRPEVREAILEGNWYITAGALLAQVWDTSVHVIPSHAVPRNVFIFRSGDFGLLAYTSITWWYVDRDGGFTAFHNLYTKGKTAEKIAKDVREIEQHYGLWDDDEECSTISGPLDEDCFNRSPTGGPTIAKAFANKGVKWFRSRKDRFMASSEIIGRLEARIPGATEEEPERPLIRWMERCKAPIRTLPVLPPDPNDPNVPDTNAEDHTWDDTSYACLSRPLKPKEEDPYDDVDDDEPKVINLAERRRRRYGGGQLGVPPGGYGGSN